jgi:hypothetical protein
MVHSQMVAAAERVSFTRKTLGRACGHVRLNMEQMPPVLESPELPLMNSGQMKVNRSLWWLVARRRWRNSRDFERRVREREKSDEAVCGGFGMVVFRGFQWYIDPRKLQEEKEPKRREQDICRKTLAVPEEKENAEKKKKFKVIQNLCSDTMLNVMLYIESQCIIYRRGLFI